MHTTIFSFTENGAKVCEKIQKTSKQVECYGIYSSDEEMELIKGIKPINGKLKILVEQAFCNSSAIIFIGAAGIAVRLIAPYIRTKDKDPAVIVIDEKGSFIIPILSGHLGGANELAGELAEVLKGQAVITTATDLNQRFAVDIWAKEQDLWISNIENIKYISSAVLKEELIGFVCDYEVTAPLPKYFTTENVKAGIVISEDITKNPFVHTLHLVPKTFVLGIGCRKDTDSQVLKERILKELQDKNIAPELLHSVATIDIKEKELALTAFCSEYKLPLLTYSSQQLNEVEGTFTTSEFVKNTVGVDNVCERAAVLASNQGEMLLRKTGNQGVTVAIAKKEWRCKF